MGLLFDPSEKTQEKMALFKYAANNTIHPVGDDITIQKANGKEQKYSFPGLSLYFADIIL